ncbi:putative histone deacetylase [Rosa chinensis]|uniref:Putative histone deacetylase n=1 Tax=Rosa chinensis TaxID=74649 RepID=A0A2P6PL96_ROSCH|nr:uncharacterized protein LOC112172609 [Rosa chinensis]XP_040363833.1 uncharacterized protein LOC112172609 [Rosa chinensis]PRQ22708.1 putative histone deacetylase [Rosa chinensis]
MASKADRSFSSPMVNFQTWCDHLAWLSSDITDIPYPNTPCRRCGHPNENWFCLCCKTVLCGRYDNMHMIQHYEETNHSLVISCSNLLVWCYSCHSFIDHKVIPQLKAALLLSNASKDRSSSTKLENLDGLIADVDNLISTFSGFDLHQLDTHFCDELAMAKEGLQKIFDCDLEALADPKVQEEFLTHSATLISDDSCPIDLKVKLLSFQSNLSEEMSAFVEAQHELNKVSDLSASLAGQKFVLESTTSKYAEVKALFLAADKKHAKLTAKINAAPKAGIELFEDLAIVRMRRAEFEEKLGTIEGVITTARDRFVSDSSKLSTIKGLTNAAALLVTRRKSAWNSLRITYSNCASLGLHDEETYLVGF